MPVIDIAGQITQNQVELKNFIATPPNVDQIINEVKPTVGAADGVIDVRPVSPNRTAATFETQFDAGGFTTATRIETLDAGEHTVQSRDAVTTANVSTILTFTI